MAIGAGKGNGLHADKKTYDPEFLVDYVVEKAITGKAPSSRAGEVTDEDKRTLTRISGMAVEQFNESFAGHLKRIAAKAAMRMEEKLDRDEVKAEHLAFMMTSATDKRLALDGSRALANASTLIQVNINQGSRANLMAELTGLVSTPTIKQAVPATDA